MEDRLKALTNSVSPSDAEKLADELSSFDDVKLTDDEQQRILSSVMRKAGFEMNETNSVIQTKRNITAKTYNSDDNKPSGRIQLRRGGAVAACLAILLAGGVIFSLNRNMHNTVPNKDRDSSIYNETVTTDIEDDEDSSYIDSETDSDDITDESSSDNTDSKTDSKTDNKTDNKNNNKTDSKTDSKKDNTTNLNNGNNQNVVVDTNKENSKENKSENKTENTNSLKDRNTEELVNKLNAAYPDYSIEKLNDNRYVLYYWDNSIQEAGDDYLTYYVIYDVPSDSFIKSFKTKGRNGHSLDGKFVSVSGLLDNAGHYNLLKATVFDDNGNAVYNYDVNFKQLGIGDNEVVGAHTRFSADGKKMYISLSNTNNFEGDIIYRIDYEDQKKAKKIYEYNTDFHGYGMGYNESNGLILVDRIENDYTTFERHVELELINADGDSTQEPYKLYDGKTYPNIATTPDAIYCAFCEENYILAITPDDNGNVNVGGKKCSITRYDLGGYSDVYFNGRYVTSANITDNGKLKCTLYETSGSQLTELRTIETDIESPEYCYVYASLDEFKGEITGEFHVARYKEEVNSLAYPQNTDNKRSTLYFFK
ncbi:hypothetical protein [Ruminococcus albus]|uniref:Uncharacterized protein n=1 Tax=Ruminococcus albus TaxID=1264 RepID=A0A1H7NBA4_RUMAL|nr:hypothetical protein [Ruminococcus albus]SEL20591.1 hypothetical protein SAMN05216469_11475 [Ruminococcus albus]